VALIRKIIALSILLQISFKDLSRLDFSKLEVVP